MLITSKNKISGSKYWINSENKTFSSLVKDSKLIDYWAKFNYIKKYNFENKILIPANLYVFYFGNKINIKSKEPLILNQNTHAEIWVQKMEESLYALDKCWQRQFYPSPNSYNVPSDCFDAIYRFYTPWIINDDVEVKILNSSDVFYIYTKNIKFKKNNINSEYIDIPFIDFSIKKMGPHMKDKDYGIIEIGTSMYDVLIEDKKIKERVLNGK